MKKKFLLFAIFSIICLISTISSAKQIEITTQDKLIENKKINLKITLNSNEIEEKTIYFIQGQFQYDKDVFSTIQKNDITLQNGWKDLTFNPETGIFIIERDAENIQQEESPLIMQVALNANKNIAKTQTNISLENVKIIGKSEVEMQLNNDNITLELIKIQNTPLNNEENHTSQNNSQPENYTNQNNSQPSQTQNKLTNFILPYAGVNPLITFIIYATIIVSIIVFITLIKKLRKK